MNFVFFMVYKWTVYGSSWFAWSSYPIWRLTDLCFYALDRWNSLILTVSMYYKGVMLNNVLPQSFSKFQRIKVYLRIYEFLYYSLWVILFLNSLNALPCSYVVDAADPDNLSISSSELHDLLSKPSLSGIPLLVLGNKIDKPGAQSKQALTDQM